jgi:peptidoglycan/xylan/chitin deacetylase (PgdA/CDA1 family)
MSNIRFYQRILSAASGGFVLAFHEIPPERFEELIDCLRPARPAPLPEVVERCRRGKSTSGLFAITVDDGVGENVRHLAPVLLRRAWPATFYLPTQYLDQANGMIFQWWRRIKPLLPHRRLELTSGEFDLSTPGALEKLSKKMELLWHTERLEAYSRITMELVEIVSRERESEAIQPPAPITWSEVEKFSRTDLIRFESHGVSHAAMSSLNEEELVFEMKNSRDRVAEHTGRSCRHLAYPFGSPQSIGPRAVAAARQFYDSATTMTLGGIDNANPWLLPRIPLYPENSTAVARLKVFLKCSDISNFRLKRAAARRAYQDPGKTAGQPVEDWPGVPR